jgi:hypothetical protein
MKNENQAKRQSSGIQHKTKHAINRNSNESMEESLHLFQDLAEEGDEDQTSAEVNDRLWKSPRTEQELDGGTKQSIHPLDAYNENVVNTTRVKIYATADILRGVIGLIMPFFDRSDWVSFVQCCKVINRASKDGRFTPRWPLCGLINIKKSSSILPGLTGENWQVVHKRTLLYISNRDKISSLIPMPNSAIKMVREQLCASPRTTCFYYRLAMTIALKCGKTIDHTRL